MFRDCYLQPVFIYDAFIMVSPSWITPSQALHLTMMHSLLYLTTEVKHTVHNGVLEDPKEAVISV